MWDYPEIYDVIVMGGGHAGCEAAFASARMGASTLLLTMNLDTIGKMSCNPAIGGIGKGHMVREIDALGGEMGKVTDATGIQYRMLNASRGPAVWAPRAQADKVAYQYEMKHRLERTPNLDMKQGTIEDLLVEDGAIVGVTTKEGIRYRCRTLILSSGTFMRGLLHIGEQKYSGGRAGDQPSVGLSASLEQLGIELGRFKTGTPPRVNARSIDFTLCEEQPGEEGVYFSYDQQRPQRLPQLSCYITYTTEATKEVIRANLHRSAMYGGMIQGVGPRYCPCLEDKVVRFAEKERHQIFLEPEGHQTQEVYLNGLSSSLPLDVQYAIMRTIPALEKAEIMRPAYAIEYDYVVSGQITSTLQSKAVNGLYFAGQINGTTGYEEAAAQGLMAGINAVLAIRGQKPFILSRAEAYIGVMIDDLVTKGLDEPYRMFTSRAEHRLLLRQDNADLRLRHYGYQLGLVDEESYQRVTYKQEILAMEMERLGKVYKQINGKGVSLAQLIARPENTYFIVQQMYPDEMKDHGEEINSQIEWNLKYGGYILRQQREVERFGSIERIEIPMNFDFKQVSGIGAEAKQKLQKINPINLGQAARISGVSAADVTVLRVALMRRGV